MKKLASKKLLFLLLPLFLTAGLFLIVSPAQAVAGEWAYTVVQFLLSVFVSVLGLILVQVLQALTNIASYQHFIDARAVVLGWVIVRDICNMFFVVVLMIIAFGTILNLENYNYKKLLPKLILMAVLINFSKTICGLLIDVAQVVMLTFVNAFKDVGAANFTDMFGISSILTLAKNGTDGITGYTAATAYVLGFIYLLVAIIVIFTMLMMLAMRIVMIWIYVVLSPAAYLLAAVPGGQKYSEQWWSEFVKNLIVGPVLAFFIWLSIAALQVDNQAAQYSANDQAAAAESADFPVANTEASKPSALIKYVIAIGMLVGGLMVSQQIGGAAGSLAGKGMSVLQKGQSLAVGAVAGAGMFALKKAGTGLSDLRDLASEKMGVDLNVAAVMHRRSEQSEANRQLRLQRIRKNTLSTAAGDVREDGTRPGWVHRKMALASTGDVGWQNLVDKKHNILTAGSPEKMESMMKEINSGTENKAEAQSDIDLIQSEGARTVTEAERINNIRDARTLGQSNQEIRRQKEDILNDASTGGYKDLLEKEERGVISDSDQKALDKKRNNITQLEAKFNANNEKIRDLSHMTITADKVEATRNEIKSLKIDNKQLEKERKAVEDDESYKRLERLESQGADLSPADQTTLDSKRRVLGDIDLKIKANSRQQDRLSNAYIVVKTEDEKKTEDKKRRQAVTKKESEVEGWDKKIADFTKILDHNKLSEVQIARTHVDATMEGEAAKKIATITNSDQLVAIIREAMESKDQGLVQAAYKKITKTGNYNDIHRALGLGTGYEGMQKMATYLQQHAGFSQQDARGLVAEVGEIGKSVGHYQSFAAMSMDKSGQWQPTGRNEQQASIFSELSKVQIQKMVRELNRLAAGSFQSGLPHTSQNWSFEPSMIATIASKDAAFAKQLEDTGAISMIQFIGENQKNLEILERNGARQTAKTIRKLMAANTKKSSVTRSLDTIKSIV